MGHPKSSFTYKFALVATELLNPFVLVAALLTWISWLTDPAWMRTAGLMVLFISAIPLAMSLLMTRAGKVTDKYIQHRTQRHLFYALSLGSMLAGAAVVWLVPSSAEARWMALLAVGTLLAVMAINTRLKISIHALIAALAAVVFSAGYLNPAVLAISVAVWATVIWSRVYLKRHSITEVLLGSLLGAGVGWFFLWLVGGLP